MRDETGVLKVIDLQYYTCGRRVWDLSFYYSKSSESFNDIAEVVLPTLKCLADQKAFTLFYLVASALSVKKKRYAQVRNSKLKDATCVLRDLK